MKAKINALISFIYILLSVFIVTAGLYLADGLPQNITDRLDDAFNRLDLPQVGADVFDTMLLQSDTGNNADALPVDMKAVWFDMGKDLTGDVSEFYSEVSNYFNYFDNFETDTLIIKPDTAGKYLNLTDLNGNSQDALQYVLDKSKQKEYYKILTVDETVAFDPAGNLTFDNIKYYLTNYDFQAVVLACVSIVDNNTLYDTAAYIRQNLNNEFKSIYFGVQAYGDGSGDFADEQTKAVLNSQLADFIFIRSRHSTNTSPSFNTSIAWWNSFAAAYQQVSFYCVHRCDLVCGSLSGWNSYTEIADQMRLLWDCENIKGSVFYSAVSLRIDNARSAQRIAYLLSDGEVKDLCIKSIKLDSDTNTVTFTGYAAEGHKLYCNHQVACAGGGSFALKYSLSAGSNTFGFFSCGKTVTYRVHNNAHLIDTYYPTGDINTAKDDTVTVMAVCMNNASVVCSLRGNNYVMTPDTDLVLQGMPEGYSVYKCDLTFTADSYNDINLGNIVISAALDNNKESVTAGRITLLKSNTSSFLNNILTKVYETFYNESDNLSQYTDYTDYSEGVSPYRDNGLGTSLMCRIYNDDTEVLGTAGEYDTYHADNSTLPEGTLDYVQNMSVSEEGYIRYDLKSGISVYGVNCELINNAFTMPKNKAIVKYVDDTKESSTDIVLDMDWLVPVTVKALPQTYRTGYFNYSYNIDSFTAAYVDVHFFYSDFYNSVNLQFAQNSPFSYGEVYADDSDGVILRLYLRKEGQFYGFNLTTNENGNFVISFKKHTDSDLSGKVIMLDPGHGGLSMTGTALQNQSVAEKTVTLILAQRVKVYLENMGATVVMTRTADTPLSLSQRLEMCGNLSPDIFVSIHLDGSDAASDAGTHTFYFRPYSQPLAKAIHSSLVATYRNYIYPAGSPNYASIDRGIKYYPFYVNRGNDCPSVLVETGFMTNYTEGEVLTNDTFQYTLAQGIANGIRDYFAQNNATV